MFAQKVFKKKQFAVIFLCACLALGLTAGCSNEGGSDENKDIAAEFSAQVSEAISLPDLLTPEEDYYEPFIEDAYGLKLDDIEDAVIMEPLVGPCAFAVTMFRMKDPAKTDDGMAAVEKRAQGIIASFENYLPDQLAIAQDYITLENNGYILLAVTEDTEKVKAIFLDLTS